MGKYSIKDLEKLSGVKAHTIRIWELRYGLLSPKRTETNIRYYDDEQLKHILNVSLLLKNGMKISKISELKQSEVNKQLLGFYSQDTSDNTFDDKINGLVVSMIELNEEMFEKIFSSSVFKYGFENTLLNLVYPFLNKVGILWSISDINPAQEHFISNLVRQKIIVAIDNQTLSTKIKNKYVLFLPEGELHEIGLLVANYLVRQNGHHSYYLGQNVPLSDVETICNLCNPTALLVFITTPKPVNFYNEYVIKLAKLHKKATVYLSGNPEIIGELKLPKNISWLKSIQDFKKIIE